MGSTGGPPRNWKGIGIAMVVIVGVMSLVSLSIFLLTPGKWNKALQGNELGDEPEPGTDEKGRGKRRGGRSTVKNYG